jgi:hypothetical protein
MIKIGYSAETAREQKREFKFLEHSALCGIAIADNVIFVMPC